MSQVKMTGDFASAMVTVVPVTLLIAVVEVSRYYALFTQASVKEKEEFRAAAQLALENPIDMRGVFLYRWERKTAAETFSIMYRLYAAIMATVLVPLVVVEYYWFVGCLRRTLPTPLRWQQRPGPALCGALSLWVSSHPRLATMQKGHFYVAQRRTR